MEYRDHWVIHHVATNVAGNRTHIQQKEKELRHIHTCGTLRTACMCEKILFMNDTV
jgi:hypothetical protein